MKARPAPEGTVTDLVAAAVHATAPLELDDPAMTVVQAAGVEQPELAEDDAVIAVVHGTQPVLDEDDAVIAAVHGTQPVLDEDEPVSAVHVDAVDAVGAAQMWVAVATHGAVVVVVGEQLFPVQAARVPAQSCVAETTQGTVVALVGEQVLPVHAARLPVQSCVVEAAQGLVDVLALHELPWQGTVSDVLLELHELPWQGTVSDELLALHEFPWQGAVVGVVVTAPAATVVQPVWAGFVLPMPWLVSHSYPAFRSDPFGY